jgi:hypothetical protein
MQDTPVCARRDRNGVRRNCPRPLPTDPSISDTTVSDVRVTMTAVQHTQIWIVSPAAGPKSPMPPDRVWRAVGRRLAAETVRSLEGLIAWLAVAGISALARRAWRPALPAPASGCPLGCRRRGGPASVRSVQGYLVCSLNRCPSG